MSAYISAFTIVVPDYDSGLDFYVGRAGFHLIEDTDLGGGKRWVLIAPSPDAQTRILLAKAADNAQSAAIGKQTGGRVGFFLHSDAFDADYTRMLAAGVTFEESPREESYGKVAVWSDPWGNRWDLLQLSS
ncbi:VOC family protein [Litoreibacter arenae]|uniref:Glyoxalase family protein n=1 Tax=Litoreibacter arenae DSM 19593 TaxID=1123360 RepID=S9QL00_9RHOB|nr:VOC family protein [Litoreibacter arenae]EPX80293.1 Glyoxalase family protein [Litoreibacter arenae DSM 19593]